MNFSIKNIFLSDHTPAILRDYQLIFDYIGLPKVEPSYANVREEEGGEVHGLAFGMDKENADKMTRQGNTHILHSKVHFFLSFL